MKESIKEVNSVFEQPWWLDIVAPGQWREIWQDEDGIMLRWCYCKKGKTIYQPKDTQCLGIYLVNKETPGAPIDLQTQSKVISRAIDKLPVSNKIYLHLSCNNTYVLPFLWKDFIITPRWTYRIIDLIDINRVYDNFSNTVKKNIKKASKKVQITCDYKFEYLTKVLDATYQHQNRKNPEDYGKLKELTEAAIVHNAGRMFSAIDEAGNIHACSFVIYDKNVCYAWCGGSNPDYRNSGAKSLLWFEAIKFASTVSNVFDFEGSMIESIENFVKQFGGVPTVYYQIEKRTLIQHLFVLYRRKLKKLIGYKQ